MTNKSNINKLGPSEPCSTGCLQHVTHPCEHCGRQHGGALQAEALDLEGIMGYVSDGRAITLRYILIRQRDKLIRKPITTEQFDILNRIDNQQVRAELYRQQYSQKETS